MRAAYRRLPSSLGNANEWFVVATSPGISLVGSVGSVPIGLTVMALGLLVVGTTNYSRVSRTIRRQDQLLADQGERLERAQFERGKLLGQVVEAAEDERKRVAAELHDGPIQDLTALHLKLESLRLDLEEDGVAGTPVQAAQERLQDEIRGLRGLVVRLRPPALDERGLEAALADHARFVSQQSDVECRVDSELEDRLEPTVETVMYRVAQEALANVMKHSRASRAEVCLRGVNGSVVLEVRDDGVGFDMSELDQYVQTGHFGLVGMRERVEMAGGVWQVESQPGEGTRIRAEVPR